MEPGGGVDMVVIEGERHTTVLLSGELDRASCPHVRSRLRPLTGRPLVLDVSGVTFFDAEGMRTVCRCARACEAEGAALALVGVRPYAAKVFRILGLDRDVPLCGSMDEALWCVLPRTDEEIREWLSG
ncbi:STAS domain-containing protein [Actinomadura sp. WMMB 499]|uniref:STAS domain-containing protein n=1 Tax=Actinomadura sp. WMMB 499 TaxID=1219491 RepID=UPI0012462169|nr:STAS domain-containing protein [Actinomadura sp. WMMB 499]QFG25739.1 STAS domain-containing protein [Actinomadura sp. WMMB 499]